ncbi:MAG: histidine phosphatase family protein [Amylibacter sp.]
MKRVILTRHAKSSWANPGQADHDRPLNDRGQRSATKLGHWLNDNRYIPNQVISSTAARCVETWAGLEQVLCLGITPEFDRRLYHANVGNMLEKLKASTSDTVLMLGHNPGIAAFAEELLETIPKSDNFFRYPTAATTLIDFDIEDWSELQLRSGQLHSFIIPRELG